MTRATAVSAPAAGRRAILPAVFSSPGAIAVQIGPVVIRWYGILMATAIVVGLWVGHRRAKREGLPADEIISCAQWAILAGLVGARLYEVAFNWDYYGQYPAKIIAVWEGGLAIHGGLVFGLLVAWLGPRLRNRPGALFFCYLGLYSVGRFAIEGLRLDSFWLGSYRVPQLASLVGVLVAVVGVAWAKRRAASPAAR